MTYWRSRLSAVAALLFAWSLTPVHAGDCPAYLDHDFRRLHSQDTVNLCNDARGKPLLIVNTASHCGFTPQLEGLEAVHREFGPRGLKVVGFSSDDFRQEADSEAEAAEICYLNYGVTFTMVAPLSVKGRDAHPLFRELARQSGEPRWNFNKYLVNASGEVRKRFGSGVKPGSDEFRNAIEELL